MFQQDLDKANKQIESLQRQLKDMNLLLQQQQATSTTTSTTTNSTLYNNTITPNLPKKISYMIGKNCV